MIDWDPGASAEIRSIHPMIVFSDRDNNARTGLVISAPMTHDKRNKNQPFVLLIPRNVPGQGDSFVICNMVTTLDWRQRNAFRTALAPLRMRSCKMFSMSRRE